MAVNKVIMNTANGAKTLIDLTGDTVTPETLAEGVTAHDASGAVIVGTMPIEKIPDYWLPALEEGAEAIRRAMEQAGQNKSAFFFYSDSHWSNETTYTAKMAPKLLKYLYKKTPINQTNFGGDIVSAESTDTDTMAYLWDWREQLRGLPNHHSVIGNHDDGNHTDRLLSKEYIYSYLLAPEECPQIVQGGDFYYYIDNPCEKTRYLYLDTMYERISEKQLSWVKEAIKGVGEGWHIVAISHAWFENDYTNYPPVISGFSSDALSLLTEFDKYNSRTGEYESCVGWVEFCIGGHYHLDYESVSTTGIPVILVEADTIHDRGGSMPQHGTTDEAAVNAIIADYNKKKITIVRIGRGENREIKISSAIVSYTNVIQTSIDKDGNIFNGGKGWAANSRIGSGGIYLGNGTAYVTGHIAVDITKTNVIRLKNITFNKNNTDGTFGVAFFDSAFARVNYNGTFNWRPPNALGEFSVVYASDGNVVEFTIDSSNVTNTNVAYIAICAEYIGDDSIITINEPIE